MVSQSRSAAGVRSKTRKELDRKNERFFLNEIAEIVDPEALYKVLSMSEVDNHRALLETMLDPDFRRYSFGRLCAERGVSLDEITQLFSQHYRNRNLIAAMMESHEVIKDLSSAAKNQKVYCKRCDGSGVIATGQIDEDTGLPETEDCPRCQGDGQTVEKANPRDRQQFLDLIGMGKKEAPVHASQININNQARIPGSLESSMAAADKALEADPVIDITPEGDD